MQNSIFKLYYPSTYERVVQHYKLSSMDHIRIAKCGFNSEKSFSNKYVNEMVNIFNETISNVLNNYIFHGTIICDDEIPYGLITNHKSDTREKPSF